VSCYHNGRLYKICFRLILFAWPCALNDCIDMGGNQNKLWLKKVLVLEPKRNQERRLKTNNELMKMKTISYFQKQQYNLTKKKRSILFFYIGRCQLCSNKIIILGIPILIDKNIHDHWTYNKISKNSWSFCVFHRSNPNEHMCADFAYLFQSTTIRGCKKKQWDVLQ
jgi:hypothetical protein